MLYIKPAFTRRYRNHNHNLPSTSSKSHKNKHAHRHMQKFAHSRALTTLISRFTVCVIKTTLTNYIQAHPMQWHANFYAHTHKTTIYHFQQEELHFHLQARFPVMNDWHEEMVPGKQPHPLQETLRVDMKCHLRVRESSTSTNWNAQYTQYLGKSPITSPQTR